MGTVTQNAPKSDKYGENGAKILKFLWMTMSENTLNFRTRDLKTSEHIPYIMFCKSGTLQVTTFVIFMYTASENLK